MEFGIASVAAVTVICYMMGLMVKAGANIDDKYIPIACGLAGAFLAWPGCTCPCPTSPLQTR